MEFAIGTFKGYLPDKDPVDIILAFATTYNAQQEGGEIEPSSLYSLIEGAKRKNPDLFRDIFFSKTSLFSYSVEIDQAMHELQSAGYFIRPNPQYAKFSIDSTEPIFAKWMSEEEREFIQAEVLALVTE